MRALVTGAAGFIGFHVSQRLLRQGAEVYGIDNLNAYYDPRLKEDRVSELRREPKFTFARLELAEAENVIRFFQDYRPDVVVHLAAQAGVRYSLQNPHVYITSNIAGFLNVLEGCRHYPVRHLVFASSSSVYGANTRMPFSVDDNVDHPVSLYAATKKSNELMAHTYSHLYGIPATGLRLFTVYGPWGRPDMALFRFTKAILDGSPIEVYNYGRMRRDFTFISDIVEGVVRVIERPAAPGQNWNSDDPRPGTSSGPYRIYNIGHHEPVELMRFIQVLESALGRKAQLKLVPIQPGDVPATFADVADLEREFEFRPSTPIEVGIPKFVEWYRSYYGSRAAEESRRTEDVAT